MTKNGLLKIAVGTDDAQWHKRFASALDLQIGKGYPLQYEIINLDRHDWIDLIEPFDIIIWKPFCLSVEPTSYFKEKIYFIENYLNKIVIPNFTSIWHYDSKIAQSYLFKIFNINSPSTFVSFDYRDAVDQLRATEMPVVFKKSWGAASTNVRLVSNRKKLEKEISSEFFQRIWDDGKVNYSTVLRHVLPSITQSWFWKKVYQKMKGYDSTSERFGVVYWQEFIPGNTADLRITVIGDKFVYGAWRNNRPNDFRASGSGRGDFTRKVPQEIIKYCLEINHRLNFDSMAYDVIFDKDTFYISEMSYAYVDSFLFNCRGHYEMDENASLSFIEGHVWPQELWIEWALQRAGIFG